MVTHDDDLTSPERDVLLVLSQSRTTASSVTLAAALWRNTPDWQAWNIQPFVEYVVAGLCDKGLVTYRLARGMHVLIRLTREGWALMGYPHIVREVNHSSGAYVRGPDRTEHWTHNKSAEGGPIEALPWEEHRGIYPHHRHPSLAEAQGEDMNMQTAAHPQLAPVDDTETRGYVKVTPELEARVVAMRARDPLADYASLAERIDLPERTVRYVLAELPGLRRSKDVEKANATLKQRILWTLDVLNFDNVSELRKVLGRADSDHDIVHVLHSLHKEGKVDFVEKGASKEPTTIHLTARGRGAGLKAVEPVIPEVSTEVSTEEEEAPDSILMGYPLLDALIEREGKRLDADNKAFKYLEAAEAIKDIDPVMYSDLVAKAESDLPFPSPLEAEYMRYVRNHE